VFAAVSSLPGRNIPAPVGASGGAPGTVTPRDAGDEGPRSFRLIETDELEVGNSILCGLHSCTNSDTCQDSDRSLAASEGIATGAG
jgi:hypothetical protein